MTVQQLIDQLQQVSDKSKEVVCIELSCQGIPINCVIDDPSNPEVFLTQEDYPELHSSDYKYEDS